ncbi:30S ribosomal protein S8 [uncultured archaeon]|nr:30S ribosomal protein S8 [uncultured archaeon]
MDYVASGLNSLKVAVIKRKSEVELKYSSKLLKSVLEILKQGDFITSFSPVQEGRFETLKIVINPGKIHVCGVVKPRFSVNKDSYDKWEQRFLPSRDIGLLIVSTSKGLMTHKQAKTQGLGGRIIAFIY